MRKTFLGLMAAAAIAAPIATATAANAATSTYTDFASSAGTTYEHAGTISYTCLADGSISITLQGDETAGVGDGHGTGTITGSVLTVTAVRTGDDYHYSFAGNIDQTNGAWTMTAYNDQAPQQGVTGGGQFNGIPDCKADAPVPNGNHGQYVSGAVKAGLKGQALKDIAKDVTLVGQFPS
jgi:hypothetical protein